jgi:hypothetical protein
MLRLRRRWMAWRVRRRLVSTAALLLTTTTLLGET